MSGNLWPDTAHHNTRVPTDAYGIAPHVHVCVTGEGSVILDLKRDKYLGLGRQETECLAMIVPEWPQPHWTASKLAAPTPELVTEATILCRQLVADGVLIVEVGAPVEPSALARARRDCALSFDMRKEWISVGDELEANVCIAWSHVCNFLRAFLWARLSLLCRPIEHTVEAIRARKQESRSRSPRAMMQLTEVTELVSAFRLMRPFLFAAEGRCLLHALVLTRFLSRYGIYPNWVIGVATQPWAAHSWVQWENYLLDTNPEKVGRFTPILVV
jgi:Transglutaminase-like superfamily